ncbi:MAG: hypothetical protein FD153_1745 [Rhodospirillaceae bacterium]|nr:MAG: hypothetical protein FD153_1745 [Rhodospirillaceae bacterium]
MVEDADILVVPNGVQATGTGGIISWQEYQEHRVLPEEEAVATTTLSDIQVAADDPPDSLSTSSSAPAVPATPESATSRARCTACAGTGFCGAGCFTGTVTGGNRFHRLGSGGLVISSRGGAVRG